MVVDLGRGVEGGDLVEARSDGDKRGSARRDDGSKVRSSSSKGRGESVLHKSE